MENTFEHEGATLEIPDYLMMQVNETYTIEQAKQAVIDATAEFNKEQAGEDEILDNSLDNAENKDDKGAEQKGAGKVENEDNTEKKTEPLPETVPYWAKHNIQSEEEADKIFEQVRKLDEREKQLLARESVLMEIDNPFAEEDDAKIAQFKKETGLKGKLGNDVANEVLLTPMDSLKTNPVLAKAIASVVDNPSKLKDFTLNDIVGKIEREAKRKGVDFEDKESDEYKDFVIDAMDSLDKIEKYREKFGTTQSVITSLQSQRQAQSETINKRLEVFRANVNNARPDQLTHTFGDHEVKWETPKDILSQLPEQVQIKLATDYDVTTAEGREAIKKEANTYLTVAKALDGTLAKAAYDKGFKDAKTAADKAALKLKLNGGEHYNRGGKNGASVVSPIQEEINAKYGLTT